MSSKPEPEEIADRVSAGEAGAIWSQKANRQQGRRAVGGTLEVSGSELRFTPHAVDAKSGGDAVTIDLARIRSAEARGLRRLVHVTLDDGANERFVLQPPKRSAERIAAAARAASAS